LRHTRDTVHRSGCQKTCRAKLIAAQASTAIHTSVTNTPNTINTSQSFDTERSPKGGRDRLGGARSPARELRT